MIKLFLRRIIKLYYKLKFRIIKNILYFLADLTMYQARFVGMKYTKYWYSFKSSWFDHRFDYLRDVGNVRWLERGFFADPLIKQADTVLDIGCGDGFFANVFYSRHAKLVDAIDIDKEAITHAKKYHSKDNVFYYCYDVTMMEFPHRKYDCILFFAVIEHFTPKDGQELLIKISSALKQNGTLIGSTPIFSELGSHNVDHKNEFSSIRQLNKFLTPHFKKVKIYTSDWPGRMECYFECSK